MIADAVGYCELIRDSLVEYSQNAFIDRELQLFVPGS